jgi:hypothetical protein
MVCLPYTSMMKRPRTTFVLIWRRPVLTAGLDDARSLDESIGQLLVRTDVSDAESRTTYRPLYPAARRLANRVHRST